MNIAEYYNANHGGNEKRKLKSYEYEFDAADRPLLLQLAGNTAEPIISLANRDLFKGHIDGVDLNCGCPQGFAMEKKIGAGLLRNPDSLVELAQQISENIAYPFSMKLRLHEDGVETTLALMEKLVERTKVKAFTLHGRFWWQKGDKRGIADWEAVRMVRDRIPQRIPIIGNGDVTKFSDFERFKQMSGVDSVMVGYGALLDPTVFQPEPVPLETVLFDYLNIAQRHNNGLVDVQRHIQWMTKRRTGGDIATKANIFQAQSLQAIQQVFAALSEPLNFDVPTLDPTVDVANSPGIRFPKSQQEMTPKEKKRFEERQKSNAEKLAKRMKNKETTDAEKRHEFAPGAPQLSEPLPDSSASSSAPAS